MGNRPTHGRLYRNHLKPGVLNLRSMDHMWSVKIDGKTKNIFIFIILFYALNTFLKKETALFIELSIVPWQKKNH